MPADEDSGSSTSDLDAAKDLQLARKSVQLMAGPNARCTTCHTAGKEELNRWGAAFKSVEDNCMAPSLALSAAERIACLQAPPEEGAGFTATRLGIYAAGAALPVFSDLFKAAYPADQWEQEYANFKRQAGMPTGNVAGFSAADFDTIRRWAQRGLPRLDDVLAEPGAFECVPKTTPELAAHLATMKTEGWGARLAAASTPMAGCGSATSALGCLTTLRDLTPTWGVKGVEQTLREIRALNFRTSYWARTSPDGRFAAFGGGPSKIVDLAAPATEPYITMRAPYDPGFFPNNDGFSFAGTQAGGLRVCRTSVLLNAISSGSREVTFGEAGCTRIIDTVYQSVGAALDGSLFWMATGAHTNDAGGNSGPLSASFGESATTTMTPMYNDGTKYVPGPNVSVKIPHEGDQQMSPSNTLLITRFGQRAGTAGFRFRTVKPTVVSGSGTSATLRVETKEIATICLAGGKPQLSFDERFVTVHQYVDSSANPEGLPTNTSNIWVADLKTGKIQRITNMAAGQKALFPHFRADGWIYFLVKDNNTGKESLVGSDVVLHSAE